MPEAPSSVSPGAVFNRVAGDYDRHRPAYPDALVDEVCGRARLRPGAQVLEVGCGTGQLTRSLLTRGLRVVAVEPGDQLIARARDRVAGLGDVHFVNARLEDVSLAPARFEAVFFASAIHWVDPEVSWRVAAEGLVDGGTLALLSYFGVDEARSTADQHALRATVAAVSPELAAQWPVPRGHEALLAGARARRANVSEVWAWLGDYDVGRGYAAALFEDVHVAAVPSLAQHTGTELNALLGTMSFWSALSGDQRSALTRENVALHERLGRPIRSSLAACLVTARRTPRP